MRAVVFTEYGSPDVLALREVEKPTPKNDEVLNQGPGRPSLKRRARSMLKGFREFVLRGNVVDLAVAVVIGAAFGAVVSSVVKNFVTPLIASAGGFSNFSAIRTGPFLWGNILNDVLTFLITLAVVYFLVVAPM